MRALPVLLLAGLALSACAPGQGSGAAGGGAQGLNSAPAAAPNAPDLGGNAVRNPAGSAGGNNTGSASSPR